MKHQKLETISLKAHPEISERWIQDRIADDPSILGLGDLVLKDRERTQPRAGRLDLLLQDSESNAGIQRPVWPVPHADRGERSRGEA